MSQQQGKLVYQDLKYAQAARDFFKDKKSEDYKGIVDSLPALIQKNGLLASLLYFKSKDEAHADLAKKICQLLKVDLVALCDQKPLDLMRLTAEAQHYVTWFKRYRKGMARE